VEEARRTTLQSPTQLPGTGKDEPDRRNSFFVATLASEGGRRLWRGLNRLRVTVGSYGCQSWAGPSILVCSAFVSSFWAFELFFPNSKKMSHSKKKGKTMPSLVFIAYKRHAPEDVVVFL
jgi:hypothetical protein